MRYSVVSPEMWIKVPILDDGSGPREYFCNHTEVEARGAIEAKVKAVRSKDFYKWREWQKDCDESPYELLKANRITKAR